MADDRDEYEGEVFMEAVMKLIFESYFYNFIDRWEVLAIKMLATAERSSSTCLGMSTSILRMRPLTEAEAAHARELRSDTGTAAGLDTQPWTIDVFVLEVPGPVQYKTWSQ